MHPEGPIQTLEPFLADHPFFEGLAPEYRHLLTECATNVRIDAGQFLFHEGDPAERFYLIRHGRVAVQFTSPRRGAISIQTLTEGDTLGWSWMVPPYRWHFDAVAVEMTRALAIDGACVKRKCADDPKLGYELMTRVAELLIERLQATRLQLIGASDD